MNTAPRVAMVLAAGLGKRLRPLTDEMPKPLIAVGGQTLIDRALDRLTEAGVENVIVNVHYKSDMLRKHLAARAQPKIAISDETSALLETGGGVRQALQLLGSGPFFVVNSDVIWRDSRENSLLALAALWDDATMDALLLLHPTVSAIGYGGMGDFFLSSEGAVQRRDVRMVAPFVFTGVQMLHPRLFVRCPDGPFSLNVLYDRAAAASRLFGLRHQGDWMDVGTRDGLAAAEQAVRA